MLRLLCCVMVLSGCASTMKSRITTYRDTPKEELLSAKVPSTSCSIWYENDVQHEECE